MRRFTFLSVAAGALVAGSSPVIALDSPALTLARQLNEAFIQVADEVSPSVVIIEVTLKADESDNQGSWWDLLPPEDRPFRHRHHHGAQHMEGEGSGVVVSPDGYILTNNHVVENAEQITVRFKDGRTFEGEVKGTDPASDIAVIKIKATGLKPAKLGDSDATRVGEFVLAIGAPFTLSYSVTFGHVSAKGRSFTEETPAYSDQDFIQTDASINPGNSGGPLVNLYGEVIAINTMIEGMNTGIGFSVPINLAKRVKDHLIAEGKFTRSWIGVGIKGLQDFDAYKSLDKDLAPSTDSGVVITAIMAGGPASKSDLHPGDVIVSVENKKVETARQLQEAVTATTPGHVLTLNIVRNKEHLAVKVQTAALPDDSGVAQNKAQPDQGGAEIPGFGLTLHTLTKELADHYGVQDGSGVIVTAVAEDSAAATQGLAEGDVITQVNRHPVASVRQFRQALRGVDPKKGVLLDLLSEGSPKMLILKADEQ
jgi:serine protease Do